MSAEHFYNLLADHSAPIGERYRAIFELKNLNTEEAVRLMVKSMQNLGTSELMKHELVYTLGQLSPDYYPLIREFLFGLVDD